ncbi:cytochrome c family protein [Telmatospirillum sp. J64-1]|uniref:c-type cytochrome n=1 Tax=Telmatospirillum sp. J64-1 TaxID=2502183 RepID=UPI00115E37A1|nr:hypothetical protein [Telmatospirillum sp. J64-1]
MALKSIMAGLAASMLFVGAASAAECSFSETAAAGERVSNQCKGCHVFEADRKSRPTGPNIHAVYGSTVGSVADFTRYSDAIKAANAKGVEWTEENLMEYLADPKAFLAKVNGEDIRHSMFFSLRDENRRREMVAYLRELKACTN